MRRALVDRVPQRLASIPRSDYWWDITPDGVVAGDAPGVRVAVSSNASGRLVVQCFTSVRFSLANRAGEIPSAAVDCSAATDGDSYLVVWSGGGDGTVHAAHIAANGALDRVFGLDAGRQAFVA